MGQLHAGPDGRLVAGQVAGQGGESRLLGKGDDPGCGQNGHVAALHGLCRVARGDGQLDFGAQPDHDLHGTLR